MKRSIALVLLLIGACRCGGKGGSGTAPNATAITDSSLAVIVNDGDDCVWKRVDPVAKTDVTIARARGGCDSARFAVSFDNARGAFAVENDEGFTVTLTSGESLAAPKDGEFDDLGFDHGGRLYALTIQESEDPDAKAMSYGGRTFEVPPEAAGMPALAHAFSLENGEWKHVETVMTSVNAEGAKGTSALAVWKELAPRSTTLVDESLAGTTVDDDALAARLQPACTGAEPDAGEWLKLARTSPPVFVYETEDDGERTTACVVSDDGTNAQAFPEANTADEVAAVFVHPPFMLVGWSEEHPVARLYRLDGRTLVASVPGELVLFWPRP